MLDQHGRVVGVGDVVLVNVAWYGGPVEEVEGTVHRIDSTSPSFLVKLPDGRRNWFPPVSVRKVSR